MCLISAEATLTNIPIHRTRRFVESEYDPDINVDWDLWSAANLTTEELESTGRNHVTDNLHNYFDVMYTVSLNVGTSSTPYKFIVDTGSSDTWLSGASGFSGELINNVSVHLFFSRGWASCDRDTAKLCISDSICVRVALARCNNIKNIGNAGHYDGLVGLGFASLSHVKEAPTLLQALHSSHYPSLAFSLSLSGRDDHSFITFGDLPEVMGFAHQLSDSAHGKVVLPISTPHYQQHPTRWSVAVNLTVNHHYLDAPMLLDSGSSLICVPASMFRQVLFNVISREHFDQYKCELQGRQILCDCEVPVNTMTFHFSGLDGTKLSIDLGSYELLELLYGKCRLGIISYGMSQFALGDVFLRRVHAVFDPIGLKLMLYSRKRVTGMLTPSQTWFYRVLGFLAGIAFMIMFLRTFVPKSVPVQQDQYMSMQ